jgi:hypothetical protein
MYSTTRTGVNEARDLFRVSKSPVDYARSATFWRAFQYGPLRRMTVADVLATEAKQAIGMPDDAATAP